MQQQQHVSEIEIRQFSDAFLDQHVDSVMVYDLSAVIQVCVKFFFFLNHHIIVR